MKIVSAPPPAPGGGDRRDTLIGWTAVVTAAGAVVAWAACCVLPMTLALAGAGMVATATVAGQRSWLTLVAALFLGAGWVLAWRRARACRADQSCRQPSRLNLALLSAATALLLIAVAWQSLIEPALLPLIRAARG